MLVGRTFAWRRAGPPSKPQCGFRLPASATATRAEGASSSLSDSTLLDVAEESSLPTIGLTRGWPYNLASTCAARALASPEHINVQHTGHHHHARPTKRRTPTAGPIFAVRNAASRLSSSNLAWSGSRLDSFKAACCAPRHRAALSVGVLALDRFIRVLGHDPPQQRQVGARVARRPPLFIE